MKTSQKIIQELETKNSWGKNQLREMVHSVSFGMSMSVNEINAIQEFFATIETKNSWGKNEAKSAFADCLSKHI